MFKRAQSTLKAQPSSPEAVEAPAAILIEGSLKKLYNGRWKKRYFVVSEGFLTIAASRSQSSARNLLGDDPSSSSSSSRSLLNLFGPSNSEIEKIDLRKLNGPPTLVDRFGEFLLQFKGMNEDVRLKASNFSGAQRWIESIKIYWDENSTSEESSDESDEENEEENMTHENEIEYQNEVVFNETKHEEHEENKVENARMRRPSTIEYFTIEQEGTLYQKALSRFSDWTPRYFRLINSIIYYYGSKESSLRKFYGQIKLDETCKLIPDLENDRIFRLETSFRVYELKAENSDEAKKWKQLIVKHINISNTDVASEQALWMLQWDVLSDADRYQEVQRKIDSRFNPGRGELIPTVLAAASAIEELDELASECLHIHKRPDILEFHLRAYHMSIEHEIGCYLVGEKFESLSVSDMLRLIDLIVAYDQYLKQILQGNEEGHEMSARLPPNSMLSNVAKMVSVYTKQLHMSLKTWVQNIVTSVMEAGQSGVEQHSQDATFLVTTASVDLFNMVYETLQMARASGLEQVESAAFACCVETISEYITKVLARTEANQFEIGFLCALINDCGVITDHLDNLESGNLELVNSSHIDLESVRVVYNNSAISMLEQISNIILGDIHELVNKLFTSEHLDPQSDDNVNLNVVARIGATVNDYLGDFEVYLDSPYFHKLTKILAASLTCAYCEKLVELCSVKKKSVLKKSQRFLKSTRNLLSSSESGGFTNSRKLHAKDIARIKEDRKMILNCLGRSSSSYSSSNLFSKELQVLDDIIDFLTMSADFIPVALSNLEEKRGKKVPVRVILEMASACIDMRSDIDSEKMKEIKETCSFSERIASLEVTTLPESQISKLYLKVWSSRISIDKPVSVQCKPSISSENVLIAEKKDVQENSSWNIESKLVKSADSAFSSCSSKVEPDFEPFEDIQENAFINKRIELVDPKVTIEIPDATESERSLSPSCMYDNMDIELVRELCLSRGFNVDCLETKEEYIWMLQNSNSADMALREEEGRNEFHSMNVKELKSCCKEAGLDTSTCISKDDIIALLESNRKKALILHIDQQKKEALVRQLIFKGLETLEVNDDIQVAADLFDRAAHISSELKSRRLEAQAYHGLASAYTRIPEKLQAGALLFQMAADNFYQVGEKSDYESCIIEAANAFEKSGQPQEAIKCLNEAASKVASPVFGRLAKKMQANLDEIGKKKKTLKKKNGSSKGWGSSFSKYFSSGTSW